MRGGKDMEKPVFDTTIKIDLDERTRMPYIETRARLIRGESAEVPRGKVMVTRMPILPPGASEEEMRAASTTEIVDDDHPDDPYHCEECKKLGLSPYAWVENLQPWPPRRHVGRNDPCPCGSGKKYKRCCLLS
jgi:preprotein translocase subunit SecA